MTGRLAIKNEMYYVVLSFQDENGDNKQRWVATGLDIKQNKRRAQEAMRYIIANFEAEQNAAFMKNRKAKTLFGNYLKQWLESAKANLQLSTYGSYQRSLDSIAPYFNERQIYLETLLPMDIQCFLAE